MYDHAMIYSKDFPKYKISKNGIVINHELNKVITPVIRNGYLSVRLSKDNRLHHKSLHRLIYETYKGSIPFGYHIDHINGIRTDNRLDNLRIVTPEENNKNRLKLRRGIEVNTAKLTEEEVMEIRKAKSKGVNSYQLAKKFNVGRSTINRIALGITWKHLPVYDIDNSVWKNPRITGSMSGSLLRQKYGEKYFSEIAKAQKFKKHCNTCSCTNVE